MNSLLVISPYKFGDFWVFDDAKVGLHQVPFVGEVNTIINILTEDFSDPDPGFKLLFSSKSFPNYSARFLWDRLEGHGNWYSWPEWNMEGWLGPAIFKYFEAAPKELFVKVKRQ